MMVAPCKRSRAAWLVVVGASVGMAALGADRARAEGPAPSAAAATKVSLPSSPASVRGLGSDAEVRIFSGQVEYRVAISVPSGWGGLAPSLALDYAGELGNGTVGVGWRFHDVAIRRSLREGVPGYTDADELELVGLGGGGRLIAIAPDEYRVEGRGNALRVVRDGHRFVVTDTNGTRYYLGLTSASRQQQDDRVFAWHLELAAHRSGESMELSYRHDRGQLYLDQLRWGPQRRFAVSVEYEPRPDPVVSYAEGFRVETTLRIARIRVLSIDASNVARELRAYHLGYDETLSLSRLATVAMSGYEGRGSLPTLSFRYAARAAAEVVALEGTGGWQLGERGVTLFDVDGDGASDLYRVEMGNHEYRANLGGAFGPRTQLDGATALELESVAFLDLDGDSRAELVRIVDDTWRYSRLVDGVWQGGATWPGTRGVPLSGPDVAVADIDGDRRMDVIQAVTGGIRLWRNTATGLAPPVSLSPIDPSNALIEPGAAAVRIADLNGDGLADVAWLTDSWMKLFLGRGDGTFAPWRRTFYPWNGTQAIDLRNLRLADLDRDGLVDLVRFTAGHALWFPGNADGSFDWNDRHITRPGGADADATVSIADANGNGSQDIVWSSPAGMWAFDLAGPTSAGMLTEIDNGLGKVSSFAYEASAELAIEAARSGQPWETRLPAAVPVPVTATVDAGDGSPARVVHHGVRDGFWDGAERRFGGFLESHIAVAGEAGADVRYEVTRYHAGLGDERALRGKPYYERVENGLGVFYTETFTEWAAHPVDYLYPTDDPRLRVPVTREVRTRHHEGVSEPIDVLTWYEHDDQGRVVVESRRGRSDRPGDEVRIERRFAADDDTAWIRDRVCEELSVGDDGIVVDKKRTLYGGPAGAAAPPCEPGEGLEREVLGWYEEEDRWVTERATVYSTHWNPIQVYADGVTRDLTYDSDDVYLQSETVSPDGVATLTWQLSWDDVRGLARAMIDPNGISTTIDYDDLDRPSSIATAGRPAHVHYRYEWSGSRPRTRTFVFDGDPSDLAAWSGSAGAGWRETVSVANGAGEPVFEATRLDDEAWIVSGYVERDNKGRTTRAYDAFYWDGDDVRDVAPVAGTPSQTFRYDAYDRVREQMLPTGGAKRIDYWAFGQRTSPDGLAPASSYFDGRGNVTRTERTVAGELESVDASYDAAGRIVSMRLQDGAVEHSFVYDSLGRMTYATDPDIGERHLLWDDRGRLLEQTNAAGQTVSYGYDAIGRLLVREADDGTAFSFHYDDALDPAAFPNTAGQLAYVDEPTGRVQLGYDDYGNRAQFARSVDGESVAEVTSYAPSGLPRRVELDSELAFDIGYDAAGRPIRVEETGSVTPYGVLWEIGDPRADVDAAGRPLAERYGNGVVQRFHRDANGAPWRIEVVGGAAAALYDVSVERNAWRGITSVDDTDGVGLSHTATFAYDGAARLVDATVGEAGQEYRFAYAYDGLQNMIRREATGPTALGSFAGDYHYGGTRSDGSPLGPRQLSRVTALDDPTTEVARFDYDLAGRQTRLGTRQLVYNGLDQLVRVYGVGPAGNASVEHAYGYDGQRVKTTAADGTVTRWFTPSILERNGARLHYVKLDDRLIARITKQPAGAGEGGGAAGVANPSVELARAIALSGSLVLVFLLLLSASRRRKRTWIELTASVAVLAVVQAGCGLFGSGTQYSWSNGEITYFHHGYAAGPVLVTRANGSVFAERRYEPFGDAIDEYRETGAGSEVGSIDYAREPHNVLNKPSDPDTGWSYHGARWMAPETARWLTPDPPVKAPDPKFMAEPWDLHPYQYTGQNPVVFWDPDGRDKIRFDSAMFEKMWNAYPTASGARVVKKLGLPNLGDDPDVCAISLSAGLYAGGHKITRRTLAAAKVRMKDRDDGYKKIHASKKYAQLHIQRASEMAQYLEKHLGPPDAVWPKKGTYKYAAPASTMAKVRRAMRGRKGIVAFVGMPRYAGTGHVDLFRGETLRRNGTSWTWRRVYRAKKIMIWYPKDPAGAGAGAGAGK